MSTEDLLSKVEALRKQGFAPKAIARTLGMRPSEVVPLIRTVAERASVSAPQDDLSTCWINPGWSRGLTWQGHDDWRESKVEGGEGDTPGLALVLIARPYRYDQWSTVSFLVDCGCLGVKNAFGPRTLKSHELKQHVVAHFSAFDLPPYEISLELAQNVVLGAVAYAESLGFSPDPDFAACRAHLGVWNGSSPIRFGYKGKPFYFAGPHDDVSDIMNTLRRTTGGDFEFVAPLDLP
jgi:hypothetical protein